MDRQFLEMDLFIVVICFLIHSINQTDAGSMLSRQAPLTDRENIIRKFGWRSVTVSTSSGSSAGRFYRSLDNDRLFKETRLIKVIQGAFRDTRISIVKDYDSGKEFIVKSGSLGPNEVKYNQMMGLLELELDKHAIVMHYVRGPSLGDVLKSPLPPTDINDLYVKSRDLASNLHQLGIFHGDFIPQNIIVRETDSALQVIDYEESEPLAEKVTKTMHNLSKKHQKHTSVELKEKAQLLLHARELYKLAMYFESIISSPAYRNDALIRDVLRPELSRIFSYNHEFDEIGGWNLRPSSLFHGNENVEDYIGLQLPEF